MPDHGRMVDDGRLRICFVCSGNICRSPMAEVVFRHLATEAGLAHRVEVDSAGTGNWHLGEAADRRALVALREAGYDGEAHRARLFDLRWFRQRDLVVALDHSHLRTLRSWAAHDSERERISLLLRYDPRLSGAAAQELDVADPYYDGPEMFSTV